MEADPWADTPSSRPSTPTRPAIDPHSQGVGESPLSKLPSTSVSPPDESVSASEREDDGPQGDVAPSESKLETAEPTINQESDFTTTSEVQPPNDDDVRPTSPAEANGSALEEEKEAEEDISRPFDTSNEIEVVEDQDDFDEFDDFDEPSQAGPSTLKPVLSSIEDQFDDFGDFDEGGFEDAPDQPGSIPAETELEKWHALRLNPLPDVVEIINQLETLLGPVLVEEGGLLTDEPPRQVGGISQIMVAESSREAYAQLTTPPMLKTLDWTRSRVRRDHLISMGVPVNLDEVDSHRLSSLPPLRITTNLGPQKRASTDDYRQAGLDKGKARADEGWGRGGSQSVPSSAIDGSDKRQKEKYGLGAQPLLDITKAEDLCGLEEDNLSLLSIERLRAIQEELVSTSAAASALLAWRLQYKDAQKQDSATYNGMISELIANAAKAKSAQAASGGGVFKRSSMRLGQGGSPGISPRVGSPALR